jgi:hypothetical protein
MSKIISNIEVLTKPIAPKIGQPDTDPISRTAVQGYFLTISNLRNVTLDFELNVIISPNSNPLELEYRTFQGATSLIDSTLPPPFDKSNYVIAADIGGNNNFSLFGSSFVTSSNAIKYKTKVFSLPAHQTISVQVLPNVLNDKFRNDAKTEIRGYVNIDSSVKIEVIDLGGGLGLIRFFRPEYDVQLTAEYRGTIIPNTGSINEFDQITSAFGTYRLSEPKRGIRPFDVSTDTIEGSLVNVLGKSLKVDIASSIKNLIKSDESLKSIEKELFVAIEEELVKIKK